VVGTALGARKKWHPTPCTKHSTHWHTVGHNAAMQALARKTPFSQPLPALVRHEDEHAASLHAHFFAHVAKLLGHSPPPISPDDQFAPYAAFSGSAQLDARHWMQVGDFADGSALAQA
jgi:hypothetical protein